ncbi:MAG: hypothetical protein AMQ74_01741 [Candidatus Methanofastidiosum methylothiophilum]|uniref:Endonuclease NucS n=1 Tax=Candidatus Methanofastidiosum methylothiophilum TaxID=1705564 RepID=A0A150IQF3_9EURY|nr:MAG: hypothetical protein AMQ74_01741 [Candidatus Methanofastidiosum methylthiophilus]
MYLHKHFSANNLSIEEFPFRRELAMEAYLLENEDILSLEYLGFDEVSIVDSEVQISETDKTGKNRIDILAKYGQAYIAIVELKMKNLSLDSLKQLEGYLKKRDVILKKRPEIWEEKGSVPKWIGILVGESIDRDLMLKITDDKNRYLFENEIQIIALTMKRFRGEDGNIYVTTDSYLVQPKLNKKDFTKYVLNGKRNLGKSRLVLEAMQIYIQAYPNITISELKNKFPGRLQGKDGVFVTLKEANDKYIETGYKRFYTKPDEIIKLQDETIAVSNQWGVSNIKEFIKHCKNFEGFKFEIKEDNSK